MSSFESMLRWPHEVEGRLRELNRRNREGLLSDKEQRELSLLIEVRDSFASLRTKAAKLADAAAPLPSSLGRAVRNGLPVVVVPATIPAIDPAAGRRSLQEEGF